MTGSPEDIGPLIKLGGKEKRREFNRREAVGALALGGTVVGCTSESEGEGTRSLSKQFVASSSEVSDKAIDFEYPEGHRAFIVKLGHPANDGIGPEGDIVAFHRACPHRGCQIGDVNHERRELGPCACHLSTFDLTRGGLQVFGVASQSLVQVELEESGDGEIFATGLRGLPYGDAPRGV